jgi:GTP-binding protein
MIKGTIAIVGRPNVGKSTLFNGLTRTRQALVDDRPGLTRDRLYGAVYFDDFKENGCLLIDTGGFETKDVNYQPFKENLVWEQTEIAIDEADLIIMVFDGRAGVHPYDEELVRTISRKNKPVIFVANKIDTTAHESLAFDFFRLGIEKILSISSAHRRGFDELFEAMQKSLASITELRADRKHYGEEGVRVALVGRPNAGKSSILNRLLGEQRSLVSEVAGTTRDSLDTPLVYNQKPYVFVDTAGIRRRSRIDDKVESLSVMRSMQAIERSDIVLLVIDATATLTDQDARIADLASSQYKAMAIIVNKWDLIPDKTTDSALNYTNYLRNRLSLLSWVPVLYVSCLENQRIHKILQLVEDISTKYERRVETRKVNDALRLMVQEHTPALIRSTSKRVKFYYATQVRAAPPTILVFCNVAREIQESYKRYMINRFREELNLVDVPLRLIFRSKEETNRRRQADIEAKARRYAPKSETAHDAVSSRDEFEQVQFDASQSQDYEFEV